MRVTESVHAFLQARKRDHNNPSLLDQFTPSMECQVNVRPANGEPVEGKRNTYTDGVRYWFNIRLPKDANTDSPFWDDYDIPFPLDEYGAEIGLSGWDWQAKVSRWVGFDFDDAMGHVDGLSERRLEEIKSAVESIPWVEVRRSTSGRGLHIVAHLDAVPTRSHTEHAALARAGPGDHLTHRRFRLAG